VNEVRLPSALRRFLRGCHSNVTPPDSV
jgi:hypothetical protein